MDEANGSESGGHAIVCVSNNDDDIEIEIEPLTEKPFFYVTIHKTSLFSTSLVIPAKFTELLPASETAVPVVLSRGGRSWEMYYSPSNITHKRLFKGWSAFARDNKLKLGDMCLFQLISSQLTSIIFKVQVLGGEFPPELQPDSPLA